MSCTGGRPARELHDGADSNTINITLGNRSCRAARTLVPHAWYEAPANHAESTGLHDIFVQYIRILRAIRWCRLLGTKITNDAYALLYTSLHYPSRSLSPASSARRVGPKNMPVLMSLAVYKCDCHTTAHTNEPTCDKPISVKSIWFTPDGAPGCVTVSCSRGAISLKLPWMGPHWGSNQGIFF